MIRRDQEILAVDTAAEFRDYDTIQDSTYTGGNSVSGHSSRISARLTLTLYLVFSVWCSSSQRD